jgi:signal transduction histidine kinase/ActR/RegA family two-component response regulator
MNVKNRAFVMVGMLMLTLAVFFFVQGVSEHNKDLAKSITDEEAVIDGTFEDIQQYSYAPYRIKVAQILRNNPGITKAFADRDRERLYRLSLPLYNDLVEENEYFHAWDFTLPDNTVLLRVQKPKIYGDKIDEFRSIVKTVHDEKTQQAGYDVGQHGVMYWIAQPVFHNGSYVGTMEFGIHVSQVIFALADRFRTEVTTVVNADVWKKASHVESGYRQFGDHVVMMDSGSIYTQLPAEYDFSKEQDGHITLNGKPHVLHTGAGLRDHKGQAIGNILVAQDISGRTTNKAQFIRNAVAVSGVLLLLSFAVLYYSFSGLIGKLESYAEENRRAKEEVEKAKGDLEVHVQERTGELAKVNASLQEQHQFLQTIIESLTHPFYVIDAESYRIILANKAAFGGADRKNKDLTCYLMTHRRNEPCTGDDHPCAIKEVKKTKQPVIMEHVHKGPDGEERIHEIYAYPILNSDGAVRQVIEYNIDATDRKKAEEDRKKMLMHLNQMQKMEAIGSLAGGIAHDFNNILAAMLGYADLARRKVAEGKDVQSMLGKVLEAGNRARDLVQQILSFSRQGERKLTPVKVQDIVHEALRLLRASIPATIELRQAIDESCDHVLADPTQIHQIIMNLCTNAYQAMREKGGVLGVTLKPTVIGIDTHKTASLLLPPGDYLKLEVSDTGHGIEPGILKRIFDPYFTTKKAGEGSGMGLAVVHGIVKSHGGQVTVYSEPGVGSTFNVYLPIYKSAASRREDKAGVGAGPLIESLPGGSERILFVDDETQLADMGAQMLQSLGYTVSAFSSSLDALQAFQTKPDAFDLVITDMTMPKMTGVELAKQILAYRPDIPIVLCTGFSELISADKAREIGIREFVMKPLLMSDMAKLVRGLLDKKQVATEG